jgi:hypothetical protein
VCVISRFVKIWNKIYKLISTSDNAYTTAHKLWMHCTHNYTASRLKQADRSGIAISHSAVAYDSVCVTYICVIACDDDHVTV